MEINNAVVLVTGANGGIGSHFVAQLLADPKGVEKYMASFLPGMQLAGTNA
jgi:nucleoside-diphosphate-sugar epimerase